VPSDNIRSTGKLKTWGFYLAVEAREKVIVDDFEGPLWQALKRLPFVEGINIGALGRVAVYNGEKEKD
jgi:hypothetical protein